MSRYLTASKIGLLALISLYAESFVPVSATIPLLTFLIENTLRSRGSSDEHDTCHWSKVATIEDFHKSTAGHTSAIPGRTLWDLFLKKLWRIDSLNALHEFFDSLNGLLTKANESHPADLGLELNRHRDHNKLSITSPIGLFVRRSQIEFTRLQFYDGIVLWKSFVLFRQPTLSTWRKRNPMSGSMSFDTSLQADSNDKMANIMYRDVLHMKPASSRLTASADDLERILEFQIDRMQKIGQRVPATMKSDIETMIDASSASSNFSFYIKFLDAWKGGDFAMAFDNLHRYFDYTMHIQGRTFYQYALVNLAIMQADFGCHSEALSAMQESIAMARENKDIGCLNFCLSWLYHFCLLHPVETETTQKSKALGTDRETLSFIKSKAKDHGMWSLLSTTLLGEANFLLTNGESIPMIFENLAKSGYLNGVKNVSIAQGNQIMVESSLYSRLGLTHMQWSRAEVFLNCYAARSLIEDAIKFTCIQAMAFARRGKYSHALSVLERVDYGAMRTLRHQHIWKTYAGIIKLQRAVYSNDLTTFQHHFSQLTSSPQREQSVVFAIYALRIEMQLREGKLSETMGLVDKLVSEASICNNDVHARIKLMVAKARIFDLSANSLKGFSIAVKAASLAYRSRFLDILWEVVVVLGRILCNLKEFEATDNLIRSILPQVLEAEDCQLSGMSFSCLADAHMGMAGRHITTKRKEHLTRALGYLERAFDEFSRIEDLASQREMMAKRAIIMHCTNDLVLANDYASKYLSLGSLHIK